MALATPAYAIVRPRVIVTRTGEQGLLEDIVADIANEYGSGFVRLCGGPGSGKSTALAHLAAVFAYRDHLRFLDEPTPEQLETCSGEQLTIAAMPSGGGRNLELVLQPWTTDELIEYTLAKYPDLCGSIMSRLRPEAHRRWAPQLACIVLDQFAMDADLSDSTEALLRSIHTLLRTPKEQRAAADFYLAVTVGGVKLIELAQANVKKARVSDEALALLRHSDVHLPYLALYLAAKIEKGDAGALENRLPAGLIALLGEKCAHRDRAIATLKKALISRWHENSHAMAASILMAADSDWRPTEKRRPWRFGGGIFPGVNWSAVSLRGSNLEKCDFTGANLSASNFEGADANNAIFVEAMLEKASMNRMTGVAASFRRAKLTQAHLKSARLQEADFTAANLTEAQLSYAELAKADLSIATLWRADLCAAKLLGAKLDDADFTGANLSKAELTGADLRRVILRDACFIGANLTQVQWEDSHLADAQLQGATLVGAHLTGTSFPNADLRNANLQSTGLAEIDWEQADLSCADLRGATFHMGSSRSGLVGSIIACEGSKTGFYTDDYEDMTFKRPEEIRKANLRGADLRGVKANGVDFYLVDLRDAKLDAELYEQARSAGAILADN
jgi:uncharacterized protein YjbI with pentapeptide repeats